MNSMRPCDFKLTQDLPTRLSKCPVGKSLFKWHAFSKTSMPFSPRGDVFGAYEDQRRREAVGIPFCNLLIPLAPLAP